MDDDAAFFNWFAGFVDGEGCFIIQKNKDKRNNLHESYSCTFTIKLRSDDYRILWEIRQRTGIGRFYTKKERMGEKYLTHHAIAWDVATKPECQKLVHIFDCYPLRAKKAADFALWRQAVAAWAYKAPRGHRIRNDWTDMAALYSALIELRAYRDEHERQLEELIEQKRGTFDSSDVTEELGI